MSPCRTRAGWPRRDLITDGLEAPAMIAKAEESKTEEAT